MPAASLEQVRLLSNLETANHKLLQIALFGQPELDEILARKSMRQLRDRVTQHFRLAPLADDEVEGYLEFRLRTAGYRGPRLFAPAAVRLLARASEGLSRRVNVIADKALLSAYSRGEHLVTRKHVREAIRVRTRAIAPFQSVAQDTRVRRRSRDVEEEARALSLQGPSLRPLCSGSPIGPIPAYSVRNSDQREQPE